MSLKTVLGFAILFLSTSVCAQFPVSQPVELGNMYTDWYPDIELAKDKEPHPALVGSGILTESQFLTVLKNSVKATRPTGFRTREGMDFYILLRSYKTYKIGEWVWTSPTNDTYTLGFALVWVPQNENKHMPQDMQPISADGMFLVVKPSTLIALKPKAPPVQNNTVHTMADVKNSSKTSAVKPAVKVSAPKDPKGPAYDAVVKAYLSMDVNGVVQSMPAYEKLYPTHLHTLFFKIWIADQKEQNADVALRGYSDIIRKDSSFADAYVWRSKAFWNKGLDDRAISDITKAIDIQGAATPAYYFTFRADYHNSAKNYTASLADFRAAIKLAPANSLNYTGFMNIASVSGNNGQTDALLSEAVRGSQRENADIWLVYGDFLLITKKFQEADAAFTKAFSISGARPSGQDYNNASIVSYKLKDYSKATIFSEKAMALAPRKIEFIFNRASIAMDQQQWETVYQWAQKALTIDDNSAYANMLMALGVKRTGRGDALSAEYEAKAKRLANQ